MASQKKQATHNLAAILEEQITLRENHQPPSGTALVEEIGSAEIGPDILRWPPNVTSLRPGPMFCLAVFRGHLGGGVPRLESEEFLHSRDKNPNPKIPVPAKTGPFQKEIHCDSSPPKEGKNETCSTVAIDPVFFPHETTSGMMSHQKLGHSWGWLANKI